ncbi:mCG147309 [Mus musculus]|nr:mCG147309 [Mus musculus]
MMSHYEQWPNLCKGHCFMRILFLGRCDTRSSEGAQDGRKHSYHRSPTGWTNALIGVTYRSTKDSKTAVLAISKNRAGNPEHHLSVSSPEPFPHADAEHRWPAYFHMLLCPGPWITPSLPFHHNMASSSCSVVSS